MNAVINNLLENRVGRMLVGGSVITLLLFTAMHTMISVGKGKIEASKPLQAVDFIRLKKDSDMETRERRKPPPPPKPKEPPPPRMKVETKIEQQTPNQSPLPFAFKNLGMGGMSGGPFLGNFEAGDIGGGYSDLIALVAIAPQYPRNAARDGVEGWVDVEITVGPDGSVKAARAVGAKPRGVFESAAVSAAYKSRFRPKMVDGKPQEQKGVRRYNFTLGKE